MAPQFFSAAVRLWTLVSVGAGSTLAFLLWRERRLRARLEIELKSVIDEVVEVRYRAKETAEASKRLQERLAEVLRPDATLSPAWELPTCAMPPAGDFVSRRNLGKGSTEEDLEAWHASVVGQLRRRNVRRDRAQAAVSSRYPETPSSAETKAFCNAGIAELLLELHSDLPERLRQNMQEVLLVLDTPSLGTSTTLMERIPGLGEASVCHQIVVPQMDLGHLFAMQDASAPRYVGARAQRLDHYLEANKDRRLRTLLLYADFEKTLLGDSGKLLCPAEDLMRWFRYGYPCTEGCVLGLTLKLRPPKFNSLPAVVGFVEREGALNSYRVRLRRVWADSLTTLLFEVRGAVEAAGGYPPATTPAPVRDSSDGGFSTAVGDLGDGAGERFRGATGLDGASRGGAEDSGGDIEGQEEGIGRETLPWGPGSRSTKGTVFAEIRIETLRKLAASQLPPWRGVPALPPEVLAALTGARVCAKLLVGQAGGVLPPPKECRRTWGLGEGVAVPGAAVAAASFGKSSRIFPGTADRPICLFANDWDALEDALVAQATRMEEKASAGQGSGPLLLEGMEVHAGRQAGAPRAELLLLLVPASLAGALIGRQGALMKRLNAAEAGASVLLSDIQEGLEERVCFVRAKEREARVRVTLSALRLLHESERVGPSCGGTPSGWRTSRSS